MTSRSRIVRLAEAAGCPAPLRRRQRAPRAHASSRRPVPKARSFDDGAEIAVHAVVETSPESTAAPASPSPSAGSALPDAAAPTAAAPAAAAPDIWPAAEPSPSSGELGQIGAVGAVGTVPSAGQAGTAPAATDDDLDAAQMSDYAPTGAAEEVDGWTVTAPAADEDEAFAQDIQAILAHAHSVSAPAPHLPLPDVPQAAQEPLPAAPMSGVGASAGHDVFDRMSSANAPNRFDQGPVSLSVDFARLDRALAETPAATAPPATTETAPTPAPASPAEPRTPPTPAAPEAAAPSPAAAVPAEPAPAATPAASPPTPGPAFKVTTDVPLIAQGPGLSCHAAACASLVAWRDEVPPDAAAVASATGYWERYADGRTATYPDAFDTFGLEAVSAGASPAPAALRDLVDAQGPLFAAGFPPAEHAVVVAGVSSDGTTTSVDVVDPWAVGMTTYASPNPGSTYTVPYADLVAAIGVGPEHHLLFAHLRKGTS